MSKFPNPRNKDEVEFERLRRKMLAKLRAKRRRCVRLGGFHLYKIDDAIHEIQEITYHLRRGLNPERLVPDEN